MPKAEIQKRAMLKTGEAAPGEAGSAPLLKSSNPGEDKGTAIEVKVGTKPAAPEQATGSPAPVPAAEKPATVKRELKLEPTQAAKAAAEPEKPAEPAPATAAETAKTEAPKPAEKPPAPSAEKAKPAEDEEGKTKTDDKSSAQVEPKQISEEDAEKAKHHAEVLKLIESKRFELPVNSIEKRKTKRFVALGIIFSALLVLAWFDIALDAGLVNIQNIKPLTHFFSS